MSPPVFVLGVRRSGTTLLRVMLDRHSRLAVPDESYFIPQLADRHRGPIEVEAFVDDLRRLPTLREWEVDIDAVRGRLRPGQPPGEAIAAVYETYAAARGKERWGDKTPMYMQRLPMLEGLFPTALYVHLIRDGRDCALSFAQMPAGIVTRSWAHPRDAAGFACQWRAEVVAARELGLRAGPRYSELRYEAARCRRRRNRCGKSATTSVCRSSPRCSTTPAAWTSPPTAPAEPHAAADARTPRLADGACRPATCTRSNAVAGDLLAELGYERRANAAGRCAGASSERVYAARITAWNASAQAVRRSPALAPPAPSARDHGFRRAVFRAERGEDAVQARSSSARSVAIPGEYFPMPICQTTFPSVTRAAYVRGLERREEHEVADDDCRAEDASRHVSAP